jgi:hypothetical protein
MEIGHRRPCAVLGASRRVPGLRRGYRQNGERHEGVSGAAVFGALPAERAGPIGLQREAVRGAGTPPSTVAF